MRFGKKNTEKKTEQRRLQSHNYSLWLHRGISYLKHLHCLHLDTWSKCLIFEHCLLVHALPTSMLIRACSIIVERDGVGGGYAYEVWFKENAIVCVYVCVWGGGGIPPCFFRPWVAQWFEGLIFTNPTHRQSVRILSRMNETKNKTHRSPNFFMKKLIQKRCIQLGLPIFM